LADARRDRKTASPGERPAVRTTLITLAAILAALLLPASASAATCSDYSNHAAQRAADTRDADGDGIYCIISRR